MTPEAIAAQEKLLRESVPDLRPNFMQLLSDLNVNVTDKIPENAIEIKGLPDQKCKECFGKGYIRRIIQNVREIEPCTCLS